MQERTHAFAMKSQIWLLDPRPNLPSIVRAVEDAFELSEASNTPVMLELRIRACHVHGSFIAKNNLPPKFTLAQALESPRRDTSRIVLPPASFMHEQEKVKVRWPAAQRFIRERGMNENFAGDVEEIGIILQGGMYNGVMRALALFGLADVWGNTRIPLHVLNVTYPLIDEDLAAFCRGKRAVLMVEEGQPEFLELALNAVLRRAGVETALCGKDVLPIGGEYTALVLVDGIRKFLDRHMPSLLRAARTPPDPAQVLRDPHVLALGKIVPPRPPSFCTGCPERPIFSAMTLVQRELGEHHVAADIGCHLFSINPPFNIGATTMGYGLGPSSAAALQVKAGKRPIAVMGDGGFWHNGLLSGVGNAVFNKHDGVILLVDNHYSAATGGQDILSSRASNRSRSTNHPIADAVRGVGATWVKRIDHTYSVAKVRDALREALTTRAAGPKIIVASSECMLNRQRRERPLFQAAVKRGERRVRPRFGVDEDTCTGDHACIRLSGCPSLSVKDSGDPLKEDPVAAIDNTCVGCGNCGEVAEAAVLCPSFYRADIVHNPTAWERLVRRVRDAVIGPLQRRRDRNRLVLA
jgi:indolepyruvate ferredoxin oxidoreductase alpha subunit